MKTSIGLSVVALVVTGATANISGQTRQPSTSSQMMAPQNDADYVQMMTMHHEEGLKMARVATTKASQPEVKQIAKRIVDEQTAELKELKVLQTKSNAGRASHDMADMMKKMPMDHMQQMSGREFDRMFLQMMTEHHQDAVKMSRDAKLSAEAVRAFAKRTADNQDKEIKEMEQLLKRVN